MASQTLTPEQTSKFYILNYDKYASQSSKQSLLEGKGGTSKILKGTLLQQSSRSSPRSAVALPLSVRSLDDENCEFNCSRIDVSPLQLAEKDLLIAVSCKQDRHRIYTSDKKTLQYGLTSKKGEWVYVRWKVDGVPQEVAGVIRYKGELRDQPGIQFGVELEEFRGAGTSDGEFRKKRYFKCEEDCGIFVPISRIRHRFTDWKIEKRHYKKTSNVEVDSALSPTTLHIGQRVCVFTDNEGQKHGKVLYCGKPRFAPTEMVGIELDHSVKLSARNDGNCHGQWLFKPKRPTHTILVPKDSVFPAGDLIPETEVTEPISPPQYGASPFEFEVGSWVNVETEQGGLRTGCVVWRDEGDINPESFVAVALDEACSNISEASDGTYDGKRLFFPTPEKIDRTVLARAKSVTRSLSAETVKDSLPSSEHQGAFNIEEFMKNFDPKISPENPQVGASASHGLPQRKLVRDYSDDKDDVQDPLLNPIPKPNSAPSPMIGRELGRQQEELMFMPEKPSSAGSVSARQQYNHEIIRQGTEAHTFPRSGRKDPKAVKPGSESYSAAARRGEAYGTTGSGLPYVKSDQPPKHDKKHEFLHKDSSARTAAATTTHRADPHWTTGKFPHGKNHNELEIEGKGVHVPAGKTGKKSAKGKGQKAKAGLDVRGVNPFTLSDEVLLEISELAHSLWQKLAENLGFTNKEILSIKDKNKSLRECATNMLFKWKEQMSSSKDILGPLINSCRKTGLHTVANELEQGLDEQFLHYVAEAIHESVWNVLGASLEFDREYLLRLHGEFPNLKERVYNMLLDWRLIQGYYTDKPNSLAKALNNIGLDLLALEVCSGLTSDYIEHVSNAIKSSWKHLGTELHFSEPELEDLDMNNPLVSASQVLIRWKIRQNRNQDLLSELALSLVTCGKPELADVIVKGLDDVLLEIIANMIESQSHSILGALDIPMQVRFGYSDSNDGKEPSSFRLLKWWRANRVLDPAEGKALLHSVLLKYDFSEAADMLIPPSPGKQAGETVHGEQDPVWQRPQSVILNAAKDLDSGITLSEIANSPCSVIELATILGLPYSEVDRLRQKWADIAKQRFFLFRKWINIHEGIYTKFNIGRQLCKIMLTNKQNVLAELFVPGSTDPNQRELFLRTDFTTYDDRPVEVEAPSTRYRSIYHPPRPPPTLRYGYDTDIIKADTSPEAQDLGLGIESVVEVKIRENAYTGVMRSMESLPRWPDDKIVGIELEDRIFGGTEGTFEGREYFKCASGKAVFVYLSQCRPDSRFPTGADTFKTYKRETSLDFGNQESPIIEGYQEPKSFTAKSVGDNKGIQGDQNSCYLDVTLYSMFSFNATFDSMLTRVREEETDIEEFEKIQVVLREKIVNPLREHGFVRADRVRDLRLLLDKLQLLPGMTSEEKDPEELLHMLVRDVFKSRPLIQTRHADTKEIDNQFLYQIFMEKNDSLELPRVEQLLHQSFLDNELKLVEIPDCLIVQMPRFGKDYKMYRRILPSLTIDITDLLENYPRECTVCGDLAEFECRDCRPDQGIAEVFIKTYCANCCALTHSSLPDHKTKGLIVSQEDIDRYKTMGSKEGIDTLFQRQSMELFAVVCIQTSHYVAFVKTDSQPSHWVFFDSMADRDATTIPGFNIPKVTHLSDFEMWLDHPERIIATPDDKKLPEHLRRLLGDAYICFYRRIGENRKPPTEWRGGATNYGVEV